MSNPVCKCCGGTGHGVQFNLFPKTGHKFGDICVPCEPKWQAESDRVEAANKNAEALWEGR